MSEKIADRTLAVLLNALHRLMSRHPFSDTTLYSVMWYLDSFLFYIFPLDYHMYPCVINCYLCGLLSHRQLRRVMSTAQQKIINFFRHSSFSIVLVTQSQISRVWTLLTIASSCSVMQLSSTNPAPLPACHTSVSKASRPEFIFLSSL